MVLCVELTGSERCTAAGISNCTAMMVRVSNRLAKRPRPPPSGLGTVCRRTLSASPPTRDLRAYLIFRFWPFPFFVDLRGIEWAIFDAEGLTKPRIT
jgi:hypothetical protein